MSGEKAPKDPSAGRVRVPGGARGFRVLGLEVEEERSSWRSCRNLVRTLPGWGDLSFAGPCMGRGAEAGTCRLCHRERLW